jgi:hypothetical protein
LHGALFLNGLGTGSRGRSALDIAHSRQARGELRIGELTPRRLTLNGRANSMASPSPLHSQRLVLRRLTVCTVYSSCVDLAGPEDAAGSMAVSGAVDAYRSQLCQGSQLTKVPNY